MTAPPPGKPVQNRPRRVHILLRDGAVVDGGLYLTDGQALAPYLGTRKGGWANIVNATWLSEGELHNHAVLQADHILTASSVDGDFPVHFPTTGATARSVDVSLEDGSRIQGVLHLADKQRLSDYLTSCGKFMPLLEAKRVPDGGPLGDIALNCGCVKAVRDAKVFAPGTMATQEEAKAEWGGLRRATGSFQVPVNREVVKSVTGAIEVITPGRVPDRRTGQAPYVSPRPSTPQMRVVDDSELAPIERDRAARVARHWLVLLAAGAQLLPPDPRELPEEPSLEDIWRALANRNDTAEGELAVQVAAAFKLSVANLDLATPEAIKIVPAKIARKLGVLPLKVDGKALTIAVSDPHSLEIEQQLGFVTKLNLKFEIATPMDIRGALDWHYRNVPGLNS